MFVKPAEAKKWLKDHDIKFVLAQFVDVHGTAKSKAVPASHLDDVLTAGAGFAGFAMWGFGMGPEGPDYMAVGDPSTLTLMPWMPGFARIACDGHVHGKPYAYDSRVVLKRQLDKLRKRGWTLYTGIEPEFMLLKKGAGGQLAPCDDTDTLDKPCYDYKGLMRSAPFIEELVGSLQQAGFDIYQIDHEDGNGQFEINFTYSDCLTTADRFVFFKMAASEIAKKHAMICTFMPKPFSNRTGTGAHFHLSISDGKTKNIFFDASDKNKLGLSKTAYHFLGGIFAHAGALTAIAAPSINSYKRLVVGRALSGATWAPAYIAYGDNNRTSMVRIPYGRLELRLPDGSCNPYLVTAALIAAGLDGVERKLDPGKPNNDNLYTYSESALKEHGIKVLPQNLKEAVDALEGDKVICEAVGADLSREFIDLKRMEWVEYCRHVSDWELNRYLEFF
jgi:glutamine synthetase